MKTRKGNTPGPGPQEEDDDDDDFDDDFSSSKKLPSSSSPPSPSPSPSLKVDAKKSDKASAMRSKHSVTEQRRRSKINERFQILRDLIPHGDHKRDTASFLLEVIDYVQLLQEKVQKYEGSYQGWGTEPTKLMPWRHSHWRVQNFLGNPQAVKNVPTSASTLKFDERPFCTNPSVTMNVQTPVGAADSGLDTFRALDQQSDLAEKAAPMPASFPLHMPTVVRGDGDQSHLPQIPTSDVLSIPCPINNEDQLGEHTIEGGTISISSAYSHGLLMSLTQALQSSGVDLSQASISIRIDLGKRANQSVAPMITGLKELENSASHDLNTGHVGDGCGMEDFEQPQKKLKS